MCISPFVKLKVNLVEISFWFRLFIYLDTCELESQNAHVKELPTKQPGDATTIKVLSKIKCIGQVNQFVRVSVGKVPNHGFGKKKCLS